MKTNEHLLEIINILEDMTRYWYDNELNNKLKAQLQKVREKIELEMLYNRV